MLKRLSSGLSCCALILLAATRALGVEPPVDEAFGRLETQWRQENDPEKKRALGRELAEAAIRAEHPELVTESATNGKFAEKEIKIPAAAPEKIELHELQSFSPPPLARYGNNPASWVIRRMTRARFELWQPLHGWLFDEHGRLLNEAKPPRRDGQGREWYGAFLPDGRWVTTDLWEMDRTLSFFDRRGKWRKDLPADKIIPRTRDDYEQPSLIGWCRCDRDGKGFVVSVGANGGRGVAWVGWDGAIRVLNEPNEPWKLCFPRDLEPKGSYTDLACPSDSGNATVTRAEAAHGMFVGFPEYGAPNFTVRVPDGQTFGFWPDSPNVYIVTETWTEITNTAGEPDNGPPSWRTWFYGSDGEFAGWIAARRLADTAKGEGMLFLAESGRVVALGKGYKIEKVEEFIGADGTAATPQKLFPDLRIGFFQQGDRLVLARW